MLKIINKGIVFKSIEGTEKQIHHRKI